MTTVFYVLSVVAANLFVASFGPNASIISAFALIGATMTLRDKLHEEWRGRGLVWKMGATIAFAGLLSAFHAPAKSIAIASVVAFIVSESVDALVYQALGSRSWMVKVNGSNIPAALVDSILFPTIAFGGFLPLVTLGQFCAKVFGGALWALLIRRIRWVTVAALLLIPLPAAAQIVSLNGAWIHNPYVSAAAGEVFISAPPVYHLRAYSIVSWNSDAGAGPTVLARVGYSRPVGAFMFGAGAGFISLPNLREPHPSLSVIAFGPGRRLRPYAIAAYEKTPDWTWTTFLGLNYTVYFRR